MAYTPKTHPDTVNSLKARGYLTFKADDSIIDAYITALKQPQRRSPDRLLYCDLDRALHWIRIHPEELERLTASPPDNDFVLIGRTRRAFMTHPETQTLTEGIGNAYTSRILGFTETRDVLGTTWMLTWDMAENVLELSPRNRYGFYAEWPVTLWRMARSPLYVECEGLEWETPDRYPREIQAEGYEEWKKRFQSAAEWKRRVEMLRDFIESSCRT